ncbi:MAG: hypothetical protein M3N54_09865 [Acidobacteriota bacterium]|nr:hypothetical protein [Acidobacteriota bacterium]
MKRKPQAGAAEPVIVPETVAPEVNDGAKRLLEPGKLKAAEKCVVCGAEAAPNAAEQLCWVCRRLKISAWRDDEQQIPAQE